MALAGVHETEDADRAPARSQCRRAVIRTRRWHRARAMGSGDDVDVGTDPALRAAGRARGALATTTRSACGGDQAVGAGAAARRAVRAVAAGHVVEGHDEPRRHAGARPVGEAPSRRRRRRRPTAGPCSGGARRRPRAPDGRRPRSRRGLAEAAGIGMPVRRRSPRAWRTTPCSSGPTTTLTPSGAAAHVVTAGTCEPSADGSKTTRRRSASSRSHPSIGHHPSGRGTGGRWRRAPPVGRRRAASVGATGGRPCPRRTTPAHPAAPGAEREVGVLGAVADVAGVEAADALPRRRVDAEAERPEQLVVVADRPRAASGVGRPACGSLRASRRSTSARRPSPSSQSGRR